MADLLVHEVIEQMSGISLGSCPPVKPDEPVMESVYGFVEGEYQMQLRFRAEPRMFARLARNMLGEEPEDEEEIQEYATEMFNVLCGRFIGEFYRATQLMARFMPTQYGKFPGETGFQEERDLCTRYFSSEEQEYAEFSWSKDSGGIKCWKVQKQ